MTYTDGLAAEQILQMDGAIGTFLDSYATHRLTSHQRTVIFFRRHGVRAGAGEQGLQSGIADWQLWVRDDLGRPAEGLLRRRRAPAADERRPGCQRSVRRRAWATDKLRSASLRQHCHVVQGQQARSTDGGMGFPPRRRLERQLLPEGVGPQGEATRGGPGLPGGSPAGSHDHRAQLRRHAGKMDPQQPRPSLLHRPATGDHRGHAVLRHHWPDGAAVHLGARARAVLRSRRDHQDHRHPARRLLAVLPRWPDLRHLPRQAVRRPGLPP